MSKQGEHGISWTDQTWNPVRGCSRVSEGCRNCYAERVAARFSGLGQPYDGLAKMTPSGPRWTGKVEIVETHLLDPLRWRKPRRVFVNSMSDLFHEELSDDSIDRVFAVMALAPQHQFQILTKRPQRMLTYLANPDLTDRLTEIWQEGHRDRATWTLMLPLENVWLGVSVEDQATADERIPLLLQTPAAVRFVSAEPLLGPVDLSGRLGECCGFPKHELVAGEDHEVCCGNHSAGLDWAVVGGESGPGARPMQIEWAQSLQRQCGEASVPFFMKQLDGKRKKLSDFPGDLRVREFPA